MAHQLLDRRPDSFFQCLEIGIIKHGTVHHAPVRHLMEGISAYLTAFNQNIVSARLLRIKTEGTETRSQ